MDRPLNARRDGPSIDRGLWRRVGAAMLAAALHCIGGLASAQTEPPKCQLVRIAEWPVRFVRNKVLIDGAINGHGVAVAIDTGASRTMILRATARGLGVPLHEVRAITMYGIGGKTPVESAQLDEFTIADSTVKDMQLLVAGEREFSEGIDVILGEDFFYKVDVEFDLAHGAVRLFEPRGCEGVSLAYWASDGGNSVDIEPVDDRQPRIAFTVEINGVAIDAVLDSGAFLSVLDSAHAKRAGVTPDTPGVTPAGSIVGLGTKPVQMWAATFESVAIGNERIRHPTLRFADLRHDARYAVTGSNLSRSPFDNIGLLLGADFIRTHRLLVSHGTRRLYFTYAGGPAFAPAVAAGSGASTDRATGPTEQSPAR